jgi:hypothetical protein
MRRSKSAAALLLACLPACGTSHDWRVIDAPAHSFATVYDAVGELAVSDGFRPDPAVCDRGLGIWQSRWRNRTLGLGRAGRSRLHAEIQKPREDFKGWQLRFYVEAELVQDLDRALDPNEGDWSSAGQDGEREMIFAERVRSRLGLGSDAANTSPRT